MMIEEQEVEKEEGLRGSIADGENQLPGSWNDTTVNGPDATGWWQKAKEEE